MPELKGKLDGYSMRVPTPDVSLVNLVAITARNTTAEEVNAAFKAAAEGALKGILAYTEDPVVSTDMLHIPNSSIVDGQMTKVLDCNPLESHLLVRQRVGLFLPRRGPDRVPGPEGPLAPSREPERF